ncbi:MAG: hypothetical protein GY853_13770 [PVC group bacterium]|nr:hypothetical protein [PVC group bacterium]
MGKVIKILSETETENYNIFPQRLTLEKCGTFHLHYRSIRMEFKEEEFVEFCKLIKKGYSNWKNGDGVPGDKGHVFLSTKLVPPDVVDKNKLKVELCNNQYKKHEKDIFGKDSNFFKDKSYIHVHHRNIRQEYSLAEFRKIMECYSRVILPSSGLIEMFKSIRCLEYVVIRNYENLPESVEFGPHSDLDLLFADKENVKEFIRITSAVATKKEGYRVQHKVMVGDNFILCDLRVVGDDYFPYELASSMINNRVWYRHFTVPSEQDHYAGLLYHALIHKKRVSEDYMKRLGLKRPKDKSVGFHV